MRKQKTDVQLKGFQEATITAIERRVGKRTGLRLALADEVGLGKTHVMGEVARRLGHGGVIVYVAPSMEVAHQNRERIQKALGLANSGPTNSRSLETRLTLLPAELSATKGIRLVCLTPNTSFQLRGAGSRRERAFLYALFLRVRARLGLPEVPFIGHKRFSWERIFYRPRGRGDRAYRHEWQFEWWLRHASGDGRTARRLSSTLSSLPEARELRKLLAKMNSATKRHKWAYKDTARFVAKFREIVAWEVLTGRFSPRVILFDEWHRYQHLMVAQGRDGSDLLARALERWEKGGRKAPALSLFVSATPFEVTFGAERLHRGGDLERLCWLLDPRGKYFEEVRDTQARFQESWDRYADALAKRKGFDHAAGKRACSVAARQFSDVLFKRIFRTERPPRSMSEFAHNRTRIEKASESAQWGETDLGALYRARTLAESVGSRSDVPGLWFSSTHYLRMAEDYQIAEKLKRRKGNVSSIPCASDHWKRRRLGKLLRERWNGIPPLWIPPGLSQTNSGKILVFSAWRAVPRELTFFFRDEAKLWRLKKSRTTTPLGAFPLFDRGIARGEFSVKKQGWRIFYPLLCASGSAREFLRWAKAESLNRGKPLRRRVEIDWARVLINMDAAYVEYLHTQKDPKSRSAELALRARRKLLNKSATHEWRTILDGAGGLDRLERAMSRAGRWDDTPGWQLMTALSAAFPEDTLLDARLQGGLLGLGRNANNYLNRPISQSIVHADRISAREISYSDAIVRYCRRFGWHAMWQEYAALLKSDGLDGGIAIMRKSLETQAARRTGTGWLDGHTGGERSATVVQPFVEAKSSGAKTPEDEEEVGALVTTRRRETFNSPFFPHVLVSTSIGQEGVDFHRYCDTVVHWNPPDSPLALEQREGRVDRYRSLQVRVAEQRFKTSAPDRAGFSPDFCVLDDQKRRVNRTHGIVFRLPYSREEQTWARCLERLHYSRLFLGATDPEALEAQLSSRLEHLGREEKMSVLEKLSRIRVDLSPFSRLKEQ